MAETIKAKTVTAPNGGFITTRGEPRYAMLAGRHYVVGRGLATGHDSVAEAYAHRDRLLDIERTARLAARTTAVDARRSEIVGGAGEATRSAATRGIAPGAVVAIEVGGRRVTGVVAEIGGRSIAVDVGRDTYRRAPADVHPVT